MKKLLGLCRTSVSLSLTVLLATPVIPQHAFAAADDDLLPIITSPDPGPGNSNTPTPIIVDPSNPIKPGDPVIIGGGSTNPTDPWGGGGSGTGGFPTWPTFPGSNYGYRCTNYSQGAYMAQDARRDGNGRPAIFYACEMPAEYDCPLFENRPHETLNRAIDELTYALGATPECQEYRATMDNVAKSNDNLKSAIAVLQGFMQNPDTGVQNIPALEQNMAVAMTAATQMSSLFNNNAFLQSRCGREVMSTGKALTAFTDILNNLAPYALMAVAINPAMGAAAKFAISGGAVASSAASTIIRMIEQGTVDMSNYEHRKALLINTCQYTKIARKVRYMQLAQSGQVRELTEDLNKRLKTYASRFVVQGGSELTQQLAYKDSIEKNAGAIEMQMKRDKLEIDALEFQLREFQNDDASTCFYGTSLVSSSRSGQQQSNSGGTWGTWGTSQQAAVFPMTLVANIDAALQLSNNQQQQPNMPTLPNDPLNPGNGNATNNEGSGPSPALTTQILAAKSMNDFARKRISALEPLVMRVDQTDMAAMKMCADTTRGWVKSLKTLLNLTGKVVNDERTTLEEELMKNPEYAVWRDQYRRIQDEKSTISRVARVMQELAKDNSVIDRSELDQRMSSLKNALFGVRDAWTWGESPIYSWLTHTLKWHANKISSFAQNIRLLQTKAFEISNTGKGGGAAMNGGRFVPVQTAQDTRAASGLDNLNLTNLPEGSRGHEVACQMLETAWLDWSASLDHLNAARFMCDMIDPYLDNKVEEIVFDFCRGNVTLDGRTLKRSELLVAADKLVKKKSANGITYKDWALKIAKKMQDLKCEKPPITDMN